VGFPGCGPGPAPAGLNRVSFAGGGWAGAHSVSIGLTTPMGPLFSMKLTIPEFLSRLIRHIPEPGVHLNRAYGLFAPGKRAALDAARALLGQLPVTDEENLTWQIACAQAGPEHPELCPVCGRPLIRVALSLTGLSPPCQEAA